MCGCRDKKKQVYVVKLKAFVIFFQGVCLLRLRATAWSMYTDIYLWCIKQPVKLKRELITLCRHQVGNILAQFINTVQRSPS